MSNFFCPNPAPDCTDPDSPISNFTSEAPDQDLFVGQQWSVDKPPLTSNVWLVRSCMGLVTSTISQLDANIQAHNASILCDSGEWGTLEENTDPGRPPIRNRIPTFGNEPVDCTVTCPDGSTFTHEIEANFVIAFSQAAANAQAQSIACNLAIDRRICLGELSPASMCVNVQYDASVSVLGDHPPYTFTITNGALPTGVLLTQNETTAFFSGIPTTTGTFSFTLKAQDDEGNFMEKTYSMLVLGIAPATLSNANVGAAYSETLTGEGPTTTPITWAITAGALPTGLTLNATTGEISGTPTVEGDFSFTVTMTDQT